MLDFTVLFDIFGTGSNTICNIDFSTTQPFDKVQISTGTIANELDQNVDVYSAFVDTSAFGPNLFCFNTNNDFAITTKNIAVSDSIKINDIEGTSKTHGNPESISSPTKSINAITTNSDGTYTFSNATPDVSIYQITVCSPSQKIAYSISTSGSPITSILVPINGKANEGPGTVGSVSSTLTNPKRPQPTSGTNNVIGNNAVYTFAIAACCVYKASGDLRATTQVTLTIKATSDNTAIVVDDYVYTAQNIRVSGDVLTNDQSVGLVVFNPSTFVILGKGTPGITSTGVYPFTSKINVTGLTDFIYATCDTSTMSARSNATRHILVIPTACLKAITYTRLTAVDDTNIDVNVVVDVVKLNSADSKRIKVTQDALVSLTLMASYTLVSDKAVQTSNWNFIKLNTTYYDYILTTSQTIAANDKLFLVLKEY